MTQKRRKPEGYDDMTHDELLAKVKQTESFASYDPFQNAIIALRAVVELHKPKTDEDGELVCSQCLLGQDEKLDYYFLLYPCYTIKAIERQLK